VRTDDDAPLAWTPPPGWVDPRDDDSLPWIQHPQPDDLDPVPPEERLAQEQATVQAGDNGQEVAEELRRSGPPPGVHGLIASAVAGIDVRDYSRSPQARGFGSPCAQNMAVIQLAEARISVHVAVAELAGLIMRANEAQGYRYRRADTGCFNCRKVGGSTAWSWHAWAVAIDANWQSNPQRRPITTDRPRWELDRWNRYGWAWGGDYTGGSVPDTMHTEFMGDTAEAIAATELARRELGGIQPGPAPAPAPAPPPAPAPSGPAYSEQAKTDQRNLLDTGFNPGPVDGFWGDASRQACSRFQFAARIAVDGLCGDQTRAMLRKVPSWRGAPDAPGFGGYSALRWQQELKRHGWRIETDGAWGAHSTSILRQFQAEKGLPADGRPGPVSWTALFCTVN